MLGDVTAQTLVPVSSARSATYAAGDIGLMSFAVGVSSAYGAWTSLSGGGVVPYPTIMSLTQKALRGASELSIAYEYQIGIDPAGGTSYTDILISDFLLDINSSGTATNTLIPRLLPILIPAGASVAFAARTAKATSAIGSPGLLADFFRIARPELLHIAQKAEVVGRTGVGRGTTIPTSIGSWAAWTSLGTVSRRTRYLSPGFGWFSASATPVGNCYAELATGDGSAFDVVSRLVMASAAAVPLGDSVATVDLAAGTELYARGYAVGFTAGDLELAVLAMG